MSSYLVRQVEALIRSGRYQWLSSTILNVGVVIAIIARSPSLNRLTVQGKMLLSSSRNDRAAANDLFVEYAQRHSVTWPLLKDYISYGDFSSLPILLQSPALAPELKQLLKASYLRANGLVDDAVAELISFNSDDYRLRVFKTETLRNLYHQQGDHLNIARALIDFLDAEPERVLIKEAIAAAGSAEASDNDDIFSKAASRILDDVERVVSENKLFKKHWKDAVEGSISTFDIAGALRIAYRARASGLKAQSVINRIQALANDLHDVLHVIDGARSDILARAGKRKSLHTTGDAIIVVPAAALRTNKLDYPEFRADIRRCFKGIVFAAEDMGLRYDVKARIRTHGNLNFDKPFFLIIPYRTPNLVSIIKKVIVPHYSPSMSEVTRDGPLSQIVPR